GPNARAAGRRLGLDLARDESEGANRPEPLSQAAGQLVASKRELVEPRRVVDDHGEAAVHEAAGLGAPRRVATNHGRPGPTDAMFQQPVSEVTDCAHQEVRAGARRCCASHDFLPYILQCAGSESRRTTLL